MAMTLKDKFTKKQRLARAFGNKMDVSLGAFAPLVIALQRNAANVSVVGAGDSITATTSTSSFEKWWARLAKKFPAYTFQVAKWNDGTSTYNAPTTLQVGTGPNTAILYNCSVSGTKATYLLGDKLTPAFVAPNPILVMGSYGANHSFTASGSPPTRSFFDFVGNIRGVLPNVQLALISQPPNTLTEEQVPDMAAMRLVSEIANVAYVPIYEKFLSLGKPTSLYADTTHLNPTGGEVAADVLEFYSDYATQAFPLSTGGLYAPRGDLASFAKSTAGWVSANVTLSVTTTPGEFETGGQALKLVTTNPVTSMAFVSRQILADATPYRGQYLTLNSRQRGLVGSSLRCGLQNIYTAGGPTLTEGGAIDNNENLLGTNFYWKSLTMLVPSYATNIVVYFYTSNINESGTLIIDRMTLSPGLVPGI